MSDQTATVIPIRWRPVIDFKDRLRLIRLDYADRIGQRVTQDDMAELIEVKPATYGGWEAGTSKPADIVSVARRIEEKIGADPTWLLDLRDDGPQGPNLSPGQDIHSSGWISETAGGEVVELFPRELAKAA